MRLFTTTAVGGFFLAILLCASGKACAQEVYAFEEKPVTVQLCTNGLYWLGLSEHRCRGSDGHGTGLPAGLHGGLVELLPQAQILV